MRALLTGLSLLLGTVHAADLAVVIDDVGYNKARGMRAIQLPTPVTIAVLPFAPHTQFLVKHAQIAGKELIIHQPMEPFPGAHVRNEKDTLMMSMSGEEFDAAIQRSLLAVPQTLGFSNHTGSLLTTEFRPMRRFMKHLSSNGLFFLDSCTTPATVASVAAREYGVLALKRDIFLDHEPTPLAIAKAFNNVIRLARRRGNAILIAHPHAISLTFLESALAHLPSDIAAVGLSDLAVSHRKALALQQDQGFLRISHAR